MAAVEDAADVRLEHLLPRVGGHVGDAREDADAGVVHEDVEAAEPLDRGRDGAAAPRGIADVRASACDVRRGRARRRRRRGAIARGR